MTSIPTEKLSYQERKAVDFHASTFPVKVSRHYSSLINYDDPEDPLRRQIIPSQSETVVLDDECADPLDESTWCAVPGLVHKYENRVLWLFSQQCPVHCRFCFRRCSMESGIMAEPERQGISDHQIWNYIETHQNLNEIILSGGDPLMVEPDRMRHVMNRARNLPHIRLLRIHSRCPAAAPERLDLFRFLESDQDLTIRLVIHINHPNEVSPSMVHEVRRWLHRGIPVLSQSVLLKGINDDIDSLASLFLELVSMGIQPYYLHHLDYVRGTSHFRVDVQRGKTLISELSKRLSGYAVPRFVRDLPGKDSKTFL